MGNGRMSPGKPCENPSFFRESNPPRPLQIVGSRHVQPAVGWTTAAKDPFFAKKRGLLNLPKNFVLGDGETRTGERGETRLPRCGKGSVTTAGPVCRGWPMPSGFAVRATSGGRSKRRPYGMQHNCSCRSVRSEEFSCSTLTQPRTSRLPYRALKLAERSRPFPTSLPTPPTNSVAF